MKLLSYTINGFGTLQEVSGSFEGGLNPFMKNNGNGKTTLCAFLCAMLYGMETIRDNAREGTFFDREHYHPFGGGAYGGTLELENNGHIIRIERTFAPKSESGDKLLYFVDKKQETPPDSIGQSLLGISKESFKKFCIINAMPIDIKASGDITQNMGEFTAGANVEELIRLAGRESDSTEKTKKKELKSLEEKLKEKSSFLRKKENLLQEVNACEKLREEKTALYHEAQKQGALVAYWEEYDKLSNEKAAKEQELANRNASFENGLPTLEEIKNARSILTEKEKNSQPICLPENEYAELVKLDSIFYDKSISWKILDQVQEEITQYEGLQNSIDKAKNVAFDQDLANRFAKGVDQDEYTSIQKDLADFKLKKETKALSVTTPVATKKPILPVLIVGGIVLVAGLVLMGFVRWLGGVLSGVGAVGVFLSFLPFLKKETATNASPVDNGLAELQAKIGNFLAKYGYFGDTVETFAKFETEYDRFLTEKAKKETNDKNIDELCKQSASVEKNISDFFAPYVLVKTSFRDKFEEVKNNVRDYDRLLKKVNEINGKEVERNEKIRAFDEKLADFQAKYNLPTISSEALDVVEESLRTIQILQKEIANLTTKCEECETGHSLKSNPRPTTVSGEEEIETLKIQAEEALRTLDDKKRLYNLAEGDVIALLETESEYQEKLEEYNKIVHQNKIVATVQDYLQEANKSLVAEFTAPILDLFKAYVGPLNNVLGTNVEMDSKFAITYEKRGSFHSTNHLCSGELAVISFCFRLAILDKLFEHDKPFAILDDPFTDIDDITFPRVAEFVKQLSKSRQILYFTCSASREIK